MIDFRKYFSSVSKKDILWLTKVYTKLGKETFEYALKVGYNFAQAQDDKVSLTQIAKAISNL